jgi:hypothetical protein
MPLRRPELVRIGDDFSYDYVVGGVRFDVTGISESTRSGFHAWVKVRTSACSLSWARLRLDSARDRDALAKTLTEASPGFPWADALTQVAETTYDAWRAGEPTVRLSDVPAPPAPQYLLDPLLPLNETTILYGDADAGKSSIGLWLALCVSLGIAGPGFTTDYFGPVLYLDWETNAETHSRRLSRLAAGMGRSGPFDIHYRRITRPLVDEVRTIQHEVHRLGAALVVVDSLGFCVGGGESINDASVATGVLNALRTLGVSRLAFHHMTHEAAKSPGAPSAPSGSRYFRNGARALWEIRRSVQSPQQANVGLYNRKMNDDAPREEPLAWTLDYGEGRGGPIRVSPCDIEDDPGLRANMSLVDQIAYLLRPKALSAPEVAEELGISTDVARKTLKSAGRFVQVEGTPMWGLRTPRSVPDSPSWSAS